MYCILDSWQRWHVFTLRSETHTAVWLFAFHSTSPRFDKGLVWRIISSQSRKLTGTNLHDPLQCGKHKETGPTHPCTGQILPLPFPKVLLRAVAQIEWGVIPSKVAKVPSWWASLKGKISQRWQRLEWSKNTTKTLKKKLFCQWMKQYFDFSVHVFITNNVFFIF